MKENNLSLRERLEAREREGERERGGGGEGRQHKIRFDSRLYSKTPQNRIFFYLSLKKLYKLFQRAWSLDLHLILCVLVQQER